MRFRTRVLCMVVGLAVASNAVLMGLMFAHASTQLRQQIESQVLSIAAVGALRVDGDRLATLKAPADQDSDTYRDLERALREVRDSNRRPDVHVKFVYTLHRDPLQPAVIRFGVDAEEPGEDKSNLGDIYETPPGFVFNSDAPFVFPEYETDAWGTWVTAQAPIRDRGGRVVGLLGVDVAAHDVIAAEERLLWSGGLSTLVALLLAMVGSAFLATRVSRPLRKLRRALLEIGRGRLDTEVEVESRDEFGEVASAINEMTVGLMQRENLKGALVRYVSAEVTQTVLDEGAIRLEGQRRNVTILFADLRGFTKLSDKARPEDVVAMLNDFYAGMIDAVMANHGFLNKFLGDGLMAMFGAPRADDQAEQHAVRAAFAMQRAIVRLREHWRSSPGWLAGVELHMGIGIHSGEAVVGNVGSSERMEYTAIGDTVNLASRLESATKELPGVELLVSEAVFCKVRDQFPFESKGSIVVRGKSDPVAVYSAAPEGSPSLELAQHFTES